MPHDAEIPPIKQVAAITIIVPMNYQPNLTRHYMVIPIVQRRVNISHLFAPHLMSAPALRASMKAFVPDFAMVPRLFTKSALVIPIPLSSMVRVLFACAHAPAPHGHGSSREFITLQQFPYQHPTTRNRHRHHRPLAPAKVDSCSTKIVEHKISPK